MSSSVQLEAVHLEALLWPVSMIWLEIHFSGQRCHSAQFLQNSFGKYVARFSDPKERNLKYCNGKISSEFKMFLKL